MVERKSGVVINISSLSGLMPTPLLSVYSASKSYVDIFSRGLCEEYKNKGITVQSVAPGYVVRYVMKWRYFNSSTVTILENFDSMYNSNFPFYNVIVN